MISLDELFDLYRTHPRNGRQPLRNPRNWQTSPLSAVLDLWQFNGKFMSEIPSEFRLPNINPFLIDDNLQQIWAPDMSRNARNRLLDQLQENLGRERQIHGPRMSVTRLITFRGDPHDGTPPKAAP